MYKISRWVNRVVLRGRNETISTRLHVDKHYYLEFILDVALRPLVGHYSHCREMYDWEVELAIQEVKEHLLIKEMDDEYHTTTFHPLE